MTNETRTPVEERYTVIKHKDLTDDDRAELDQYIQARHIPTRKCLVIEADWPEYDPAWRMIEARMLASAPAPVPNSRELIVSKLQTECSAVVDDTNHLVAKLSAKYPPAVNLTMHDILRALEAVPGAPMMTSNMCHAIAQQLNAAQPTDAQRAIAELQAKLDDPDYPPKYSRRLIAELREECERLRMQLAACGVVALANTPESAAQARQMHPDYMSASCSDVADAVDREMTLRQQLAERDATIARLEAGTPRIREQVKCKR